MAPRRGQEEEEHHDRLDMEADFEGGQFIDGEFYYASKRQKRQQTKEDQLFGVFNESDSDGEHRQRGGLGGGRKDYTKPVGFVSSGIVNQQPEDEEAQPSSSRYDVQGPPGQQGQEGTRGLGGGAGGLGFKQEAKQEEPPEEEDDHGVLSTALGSR